MANTSTWTGANSDNWNDPGNWSPNGVPGAGDNITIPSSATNQPTILNDSTGTLVGTVDNDGTISVDSTGAATVLAIGSGSSTSVTLTSDPGSTGIISLSIGGNNLIQGGTGVTGAFLENVNNIIEGAGGIYDIGGLTVQNDAAGIIDADLSNPLTIGTNITNDGTIESTGSGGLTISGNAVINQSGGGKLEAEGGNVSLSPSTIEGGTLTTTGSNVIAAAGFGTPLLDGQTGGALTISQNSTVLVQYTGDALALQGSIVNDGTISLAAGAGQVANLDIGSGSNTSATLSGGGTVSLSNSGTDQIQGNASATATLTNVNDTIEGGGTIQAGGGLTVVNQNVIDANQSNALTINTNITNDATIESTGSGGLTIGNGAVINQSGGGTLEAEGGNVSLDGATIEGGTLTTTGSNVIAATGFSNLLDGVSGGALTISSGTVQVNNGNTLALQGSIVNDGTISVDSSGNGTRLYIGSGGNTSVTLGGGGTVLLSNFVYNLIQGNASATATLTNVNDTIEGAGTIQAGSNGLTVVNQGVIDATDSAALTITTAVTNEGALESTAGTGGLTLSATIDDTDGGANDSGKIIAGSVGESNPTQVDLNGATIVGGTLTTVNTGDLIEAAGGTDVLDGATPGDPLTIASGSTVQVNDEYTLYLQGVIADKGTISVDAVGDTTVLDIGYGSNTSVTLNGGGTVSLSSNSGVALIQGGVAGATLTNDDTIQGAGTIQAGAGLSFTNQGVIDANQSKALTINMNITNDATIESTGSGGLTIANIYGTSAVINQSGGGTLEAEGGNVSLYGATIEGGTLTTTGTSVIAATADSNLLDGLSGGALTISQNSTVQVNNGQTLYLQGAIADKGTISVDSGGGGTALDIGYGSNTSVTLNGGGTVLLSNSANNIIQGGVAGASLTNDDTIQGAGLIQAGNGLAIANQGVIEATDSANALTVTTSLTNAASGVLSAEAGATLALSNGALTNISADPNHSGGSQLVGGAYDVVDPTGAGTSTIAISGGGAAKITTIGGSGAAATTVNLYGATSQLTSNGATLASSLLDVGQSGTLSLYYGVKSGTQQDFADANALTVDGGVNLYGAQLSATTLTIDPTGVIFGEGDVGSTLETAQISGPVVNDGQITSGDGLGSPFSGPLPVFKIAGAVSGTGAINVGGDSLLELGAAVGAGQTVSFLNTETTGIETLKIDSTTVNPATSGAFRAAIDGFRQGDAIDLSGFSGEQNFTFTGGVLTVNFAAGGTAVLDLNGVGTQDNNFHFASDGGSGTLITLGMSAQLADDTSNGHDITSNPALTGVADAGQTVEIFNGATELGTAVANSTTGVWSFTPRGLADGPYTLTANELNGAGDLVGQASVSFTLDTTAPTVTITSAGGTVSSASRTISGSVTEPLEAAVVGTTVDLFDNGGTTPFATTTVGSGGNWMANVTLASGVNSITASDTDVAGNVGTSNAVAYSLQYLARDDFNGDGKSDLLLENTSGAVDVGEVVNGAESYAQVAGLGPEWTFEGNGDFLGDGGEDFLIYSTSGAIDVGEVSKGATTYSVVGGLGSEWSFEGTGDFLSNGQDQFLIENSSGVVVLGNVVDTVVGSQAQYAQIATLGPEWSFEGTGDLLGDGKTGFLIENTSGAVDVGEISNGTTSFTQVAALGSEWKFVGTGDFLGNGQDQFLIENTSGAVDVGNVVNGVAQYTQVAALGPEWSFIGMGDYLGMSVDGFMIENTSGAVVLGTISGGQAQYALVGALGKEWASHS